MLLTLRFSRRLPFDTYGSIAALRQLRFQSSDLLYPYFAGYPFARGRDPFDEVRLHDLRHSFASRALALGETLPVIGKLLGHTDIETTARYAHLAQDSLHNTAVRIAKSIAADVLYGIGIAGIAITPSHAKA